MISSQLHDVPCPQCGSWKRRTILKEEDRFIVKCAQCRFMYTTPQMTEEARIAALNSDYAPATTEEQFLASSLYQRDRVEKTIELMGTKRGNWLDVGCAAGVLLSAAEKAGFIPSGFEIRAAYARQLREERPWDVRSATSLAKAGFAAHSFQVISLIDTLYYMPDPLSEFHAIRELLAPSGLFVCKVVNSRYMLFKSTGILNYLRFGRWSCMNTDFYALHLTIDTLRGLLDKAGFSIIKQDVGQPWMVGSSLNLFIKRSWTRFSRFLLQVFGVNLGASIDIWAVAK